MSENRGEKVKSHKIKEHQVHEIRRLLLTGEPKSVIAAKYEVTPAAIRKIELGYSWRHVACPQTEDSSSVKASS